jgi:hypothetical protein
MIAWGGINGGSVLGHGVRTDLVGGAPRLSRWATAFHDSIALASRGSAEKLGGCRPRTPVLESRSPGRA